MAIEDFGKKISNEPATIHLSLLPALVKDMTHGQDGYIDRGDMGANPNERKSERKIWLDGHAIVYTADELKRIFDEDGENVQLARVVRLKGVDLGGEQVNGYYVDDSILGPGPGSHSDDRLSYYDPTDPAFKPVKVVGYIADPLGAEWMIESLNRQFALELGRNALTDFVSRP